MRIIATVLLTLLFVGHAMSEEKIRSVPAEDPEMVAAINKARSTIQQFIDALCSSKEGQKSFLMKVAFSEEEHTEHIWIADLDFSGPHPRGVVANEPKIKTLKFMQVTEFDPQQVTDWMYVDHGVLIGGYTTRVLRDKLSPEEREDYDAKAPYKFE